MDERDVTRRETTRLLKAHLPGWSALLLASDEAVTATLNRVTGRHPVRRKNLDPKLRGQMRTPLWVEAVREFILTMRPPGIAIHDPYGWPELIVGGRLHVRLQTDHGHETRSERRAARNRQEPDQLLDFPYGFLNVDVNAHVSETTGAPQHLIVSAPDGDGHVWAPITVGLQPGRRQLQAWRNRPLASVPWLTPTANLLDLISPPTAAPAPADSAAGGPVPFRQAPRPAFGDEQRRRQVDGDAGPTT